MLINKIKSAQLSWTGIVEGDEDIDFLVTENHMLYTPKIYTFPAYVGVKNIGY
jgi:hypothetical protein